MLLRYWYVGAIAALVLAVAAVSGHAARLSRDLTARTVERDAARAATAASEKARDREAKAATASFEGLQETCTAMGAAGIQKGRTIERIISAPPPATGGLRGRVGAGELCDIVPQACPASARPVRP